MDSEEIDGAFFYECLPEQWQCLQTCISEDQQRLVRIYRVDNSHRVAYFKRGAEYNWAGEVWGQAKPASSVADTLEQAQLLVSMYVATQPFYQAGR